MKIIGIDKLKQQALLQAYRFTTANLLELNQKAAEDGFAVSMKDPDLKSLPVTVNIEYSKKYATQMDKDNIEKRIDEFKRSLTVT